MIAARAIRRTFVLFLSLLAAVPAAAQQTGAISGKVTDTERRRAAGRDGRSALRRAAVAARHGHRRQRRVPAAGAAAGQLHGRRSRSRACRRVTRQAQVQLGAGHGRRRRARRPGRQPRRSNVTATASLIDKDSATIKSGVSNEQIMALPVGAGIPRPAEADSRACSTRRTRCAARAPAAAARTTSTSSTAST